MIFDGDYTLSDTNPASTSCG